MPGDMCHVMGVFWRKLNLRQSCVFAAKRHVLRPVCQADIGGFQGLVRSDMPAYLLFDRKACISRIGCNTRKKFICVLKDFEAFAALKT